jgi:hypothetical protein
MGCPVIDSHVHLGTAGVPLGPADPAASFARWRTRAAAVGIHRAVLMALRCELTRQQRRGLPGGRDPALVCVHQRNHRPGRWELVAAAHSRGACGIAHWSDGPATGKWRLGARTAYRLFDPGGDVDRVVHLAAPPRGGSFRIVVCRRLAGPEAADGTLVRSPTSLPIRPCAVLTSE